MSDDIEIEGVGLNGLVPATRPLDCGNSGTSARLLLGVLAGCAFRSVLTGDASLRARPMRRVTEPLAAAGAVCAELDAPDRLPIAVQGGMLRPIVHHAPRASAQVKSALLLAGLTGGTSVWVSEPQRSRDHTERMLAALGAHLATGEADGRAWVKLDATRRLDALDFTVPGDFSSAAFFLAWSLLTRRAVRISGVGINPTRTGLLDVLQRMQAGILLEGERMHGGEPVADLVCRPAVLVATDVAGAEVVRLIDEVPALAVVAARAAGETRISGAAELRVKESDRIAALAGNLRALGVAAEELADGLVIRGTDAPLRGNVQCQGDHRIAMAFGVLAAQPGNDIRIDDPAVAAISFPSFWDQLHAARTGA
jgi:3-phosphoshikimate 1-carboxyvinyltransferase